MHTQLTTLTLLAVLLAPAAFAQKADGEVKKGKGKGQAAQSATVQLLKQLEPAALTAEQTAKIKEMGKKAEEEIIPNAVGNDTFCESLLAAGDGAGAISLQYHY